MTNKDGLGNGSQPASRPRGGENRGLDEAIARERFDITDLGADIDAPPAYGEVHDQLHLEQAGFEAGAAVTDDGRVNININLSSRNVADLLAPALRNQLREAKTPAGPLPPAYIPPSLGGQPGQTPPPKLNLVVQIVGSRGDVQPFVALGKVLKDTYGHRVRVATHPTFQQFVEENGLEFFSIGGDPAELMAFMVKNPGLMPGLDTLKSGEVTKRRKGIEEIVLGCWRSCIEVGNGLGPAPLPHKPSQPVDFSEGLPGNPDDKPFVADAIIANPPSFAHIHIAEKLGIPLHMMFTMPWSPTRAFPHPLANIQSSNTDVVMTNYVSYALVEMMTWQGLGDVINRFRTNVLDLEPLSLIWAPGLLTRLRIPTTYCWSPALIPKPNDWGNQISISGFYFLNLASAYTPEPDLAAFLEAGPPPVYIGFGSIVVDNPNQLTRMIFDAVSSTGVRALVSKGWGGIGADSVGIPEGVYMLGNCPHDWLFKHVSAVVHHGGAGTTAAGINLGVPTVVVPFFGDQPFWGAMIARAGAGPAPVPYKELTAEKLAEAIQDALKPETQARAKELGEKIRSEKGTDVGGKSFHDTLDMDALRCSLAPSRVAVWRVRRTQTRLSALAAAVLVKEGVIGYADLKLYRSKEYNTEEQPWDPVSAVTSSLLMDISGITMAIADFPRDMFKAAKKRSSNGTNSPPSDDPTKPAPDDVSVTSGGAVASSSTSQHLENTLSNPASSASALSPDNTKGGEPAACSDLCEVPSADSSTAITSPENRTLSPAPVTQSPAADSREAATRPARERSTSGREFTMDTAMGAGKAVSRIVGTGMRSPMNFCLGLARGFRNAPRLYNDETIREPEKVTGFASGLKVAGKEFGFGLYDGISGLVTQPLKGAEKEGGMGLLKGSGKGIGGLVLKSASAIWSLPAYAMQGVHAEIRNMFAKSVNNYIITSRVAQGEDDLKGSTPGEREDIVIRWHTRRADLKGFYNLRDRGSEESNKGKGPAQQPGESQENVTTNPEAAAPPKSGWLHTRHLSFESRKKLQAQKEAWKQRYGTSRPNASTDSGGEQPWDFERAILESVKQTSRGNAQEDARIEQAIRTSVNEMRRVADLSRDFKDPSLQNAGLPQDSKTSKGTEEGEEEITDEEYQALIEEAVRQSLSPQTRSPLPPRQGAGAASTGSQNDYEDDELRRAMEASKAAEGSGAPRDEDEIQQAIEASKAERARGGEVDEEQLQRAIEESKRAAREREDREASARTEEEVVLEYVKKQSLAEEEFRRQRAKGKAVGGAGVDDDDADEELKRALEESLKMKTGGEAGPSRLGGAE